MPSDQRQSKIIMPQAGAKMERNRRPEGNEKDSPHGGHHGL